MKRLKLLLILVMSLFLTGCIQEYEVTEEQSNAIAEYMASMILKYDMSYHEALLPMEDILGETSSGIDTSVDRSEDNYGNNASISDNSNTVEVVTTDGTVSSYLSEIIGEPGSEVKYSDYKVVDSYPEDPVNEGFYLEYNKGYQYLVASFTVKNTTKSKQEINLIKSGIKYELNMNGTKTYEPALTLLENDLRYLDLEIGAGKSEKVLLVFKIVSDTEDDDIVLKATKNNKTITIVLR